MKIKHIIRLFGIAAIMDLRWMLRDTKYTLLAISADLISNLSVIAGIFLIAERFNGIGGMSRDEVLLMLSYSTIVTGIFYMFCSGNNGHVSRIIGRGQLEHLFMQPVSIRIQLLTSGFCPFTGSSSLVAGIILMSIAINNLSLIVTWWWLLSVIVNVFVTITIIIAQSYLYSSIAFYAPVAAEEISSYVIDASGYISSFPLSGMPLFIQLPLITFIPTGLIAWYPTLALLGKAPLGLTAAFPAVIALMLAVATTYFFRRGMKYYMQRGANRYVPYGYRR